MLVYSYRFIKFNRFNAPHIEKQSRNWENNFRLHIAEAHHLENVSFRFRCWRFRIARCLLICRWSAVGVSTTLYFPSFRFNRENTLNTEYSLSIQRLHTDFSFSFFFFSFSVSLSLSLFSAVVSFPFKLRQLSFDRIGRSAMLPRVSITFSYTIQLILKRQPKQFSIFTLNLCAVFHHFLFLFLRFANSLILAGS